MSLNGSVADLQKAAIQLYLKLQQRFKDNALIRELWSAMANDLSQQKSSLKALPPSFWNQLQKEQIELLQAVVPYARLQVTDNISDMPLKSCIEGALQFEEPTILKIYIPIIRSLRENLTKPALEFYIMVKAHLARIARMTASFSGDPVIIQRSSLLLQSFEREIQEPPVEEITSPKKARGRPSAKRRSSAKGMVSAKRKAAKRAAEPRKTRARPVERRSSTRKAAKPKKAVARKSAKPKKASNQGSALAKRAKSRHRRAKSLSKKVNLQRGRARARR